MPFRRIHYATFLLTIVGTVVSAQPLLRPSGSMSESRSVTMKGNNVAIVVYNYGMIGRPNTLAGKYDFVWRGEGNMMEFGPLLAAEVTDTSGHTVRILDDGMNLLTEGGYSPDGTTKWGWLPRLGYARTGSPTIPTLRDTTSWPSIWSAWPGSTTTPPGVQGDQAYYVMDDFTNEKYAYFPFPTDSLKRGLGVSAQGWVSQYTGALQDAIIVTFRLRNESLRALGKCYFGFFGDPIIGGANDYADDLLAIVPSGGPPGDPRHGGAGNTIYCYDSDGLSQSGKPAAYMGLKLLSTPGGRGLTAFSALQEGSPNVPKVDTLFSRLLFADSINWAQPLFSTPTDNVVLFGTGPFALAPGDSTDIVLGMFFSESPADVLDDASMLHYAWHWPTISDAPGQTAGDPACAIQLTSPVPGTRSGDIAVTWNYSGTDPQARVFLEYSRDGGNQWTFLDADLNPLGSYVWHSNTVPDGTRYLLRAVSYSADMSTYAYSITGAYLTIDNPVNAQPELAILSPAENSILRSTYEPIEWEVWDADNSTSTLQFSYGTSSEGPFTPLYSGTYATGHSSLVWDVSGVPNGETYYLKVIASDGLVDSTVLSKRFIVAQQAGSYTDTIFHHTAGKSTPTMQLLVTDHSLLTGRTYDLTFEVPSPDSAKRVTVHDRTTGAPVLTSYHMAPGYTTPAFDGVKLGISERATDVDTINSRFTRAELLGAVNFRASLWPVRKKVPEDWLIVFNAMDTLHNGHYIFPGDSGFNQFGKKVVVCPFRVINLDSLAPGRFIVANTQADSLWRPGRPLGLVGQGGSPSSIAYQVNFDFSNGKLPHAGDTLRVTTFKPITSVDVFQFTTGEGYVLSAPSTTVPLTFALHNNYPNPFNPKTVVSYQLPVASKTTIIIYDVLGREVAQLVHEAKGPGQYEVTWDASGFPSGMYICRMTAGSFTTARKIVLVK
jgi:hypothetical protein